MTVSAQQLDSPLRSLQDGRWFKLICGASYQHLPAIRNLALVYSLAGADCIDVAADPAVIRTALQGIEAAQTWLKEQQKEPSARPLLMVSLNDDEDPHFRKATFDPTLCPSDCPQPCISICPAEAIAFTSAHPGVIADRCYGCGRCVPVCPVEQIDTRSHQITPETILPLVRNGTVQAIEIHTQVGHEAAFVKLWQQIKQDIYYLDVLAISCPDGEGALEYLHWIYEQISPLPCALLWQTDGRPMSGDIGDGATRAAIKWGEKVLHSSLPGFVQLAGGTNAHTVDKLKELGLLKVGERSSKKYIAGIAYGSYARTILNPIWHTLEAQDSEAIEQFSEPLNQAIHIATGLTHALKTQSRVKNKTPWRGY
jgi:Fe-S-cluster-containing hydrogenase component 2